MKYLFTALENGYHWSLRNRVQVACVLLASSAWLLTGCEGEDYTLTSRLSQSGKFEQRPKPDDVGDLALAGSNIAQQIRTLPVITSAAHPPIIELQGVTSVVTNGIIDTEPYADLLRDRLNAGDDNKVRFMERQLPQTAVKHRHGAKPASDEDVSPDYRLFAELQGNASKPVLVLQIQLIDANSNAIVFDHSYVIQKETGSDSPAGDMGVEQQMQPPPQQPPQRPQPQGGGLVPPPNPGGSEYSPNAPSGVQ